MASLALDPIIVAKINALLASSFSKDSGYCFAAEDIVELFETFLSEQIHATTASAHTSPSKGPLSKPQR